MISQALPRTVTSLCGKEEEKEEERGGKWAGGCLMGITNTRHTMTHPASAYLRIFGEDPRRAGGLALDQAGFVCIWSFTVVFYGVQALILVRF